MTALNLGCGTRTSERCVNIDWSIPVRLRQSSLGRKIAPRILRGARWELYASMSGEVMSHDLRKGIPFPDNSADVVYHSHVLEHIDREYVPGFLAEIHRVLKPGGIHRIAVPDLERRARDYVRSLDAIDRGETSDADHDAYVSDLLEQSVRREAAGTAHQRPARRFLENAILGDARKRGETHQWMWDRINLAAELRKAGFSDVRIVDYKASSIEDWAGYLLDQNPDGSEYKTDSMYAECTK